MIDPKQGRPGDSDQQASLEHLPRFDPHVAAALLDIALGARPDDAYARFAVAYVRNAEATPDRLGASGLPALNDAARVALDHFRNVSVNADADAQSATLEWLAGAYVVNRTVEAIDDIAERFVGVPVLSVDLMIANVLITGALGDSFANRLEQLAVGAVDDAGVTNVLLGSRLGQDQLRRLGSERRALDGEVRWCLAEKFGLHLPGL